MAGTSDWLSKELFQTILREHFQNKDLEVSGYTSKPAIAVGENYTSDLLRTSIAFTKDGKENSFSVIVKCFPQIGLMVSLVEEMALFEIEVVMYTKIFPTIYTLLDNSVSLAPACLYSEIDPHKMVIFEDISPLGYKTHPRQHGLDLQHCLLVMEKLAYLHATTMVLCEKDPSLVSHFKHAMYRDNEFTKSWVTTGIKAVSDACTRWPGFEKYSPKLKAMQDKIVEKAVAAGKPNKNNLNVLNHGDAWINNYMFSYTADGKLKDLKFVDFQIVVYSSPGVDLNYFWAGSPSIDVRKHHLNTALDQYHKTFCATLTKLQYLQADMPTREQIQQEFESRAFYGLAASFTNLAVVEATSRKDATIDEMIKNDSKDGFQYDAYNNERYRQHMEYQLQYYDQLGLFD